MNRVTTLLLAATALIASSSTLKANDYSSAQIGRDAAAVPQNVLTARTGDVTKSFQSVTVIRLSTTDHTTFAAVMKLPLLTVATDNGFAPAGTALKAPKKFRPAKVKVMTADYNVSPRLYAPRHQ